ncbi:DUF4382 domain-containing protein [Thioalkalivibrio sp. ALMg3]|uniref:DUF4382 domain-containing protein n=1 Tax=Thioalkalivibrio sp. ALMg3 TaxID=1158163 RepID=UPI0003709A5B|nr:DUF4382 domain-containing protein [Thioalkalivibrio sp. ALMg3]
MHKIGNLTRLVGFGIATAGLVACGGGGSSGGGTGQMSLAVTDAPVDSASRVVVRFTHVELKPEQGGSILIDVSEEGEPVREIDLLTLQGEDFKPLFENEEVPAGDYAWLRFHLEKDDERAGFPGSQGDIATTSFIEFVGGNQDRLIIPGANQAGLQLSSGFSVPEDGQVSFTVDFDLRKAIKEDSREGFHRMRRSLRLVDNSSVGSITGTVDPTIVPGDRCEEREEGLHACPGVAVYVFEDHDREPRDLRDDDDDAVTTANVYYRHVEATDDWEYRYTAGFLEAGDHTVALTFEADQDDPEEATLIEFVDQANAEVTAGDATRMDFSGS